MNVLDIFSGIGGFSLGLERAGMRTVAFCEIDPFCRRILAKHWPTVPIHEDIKKLRGADVGAVDVICGGFPCTDISVAGKGLGITGPQSGLWSEYARIIGELRPRYVIVENVAALLSRGLDVVLGDLSSLGYDAEWHCIPASAVGAPHRRDRLWIIANAQRDNGRSHATRHGLPTEPAELQQANRQACANNDPPLCRNVADANDTGRQQQRWGVSIRAQLASAECGDWWFAEPDVGRVAHGVPSRVDRLHALGNAVVPFIPEIIGRAIMSRIQPVTSQDQP